MRKGKLGIAVFSAAVLLAILLMAIRTIPVTDGGNPVAILAGDEILQVWTEDGQNYYAFLPGHVQTEQVMILPVQDVVTVNGKSLPLSLEHLDTDQPCELAWQENNQEYSAALHILKSEGTATLYLNTQSGSMDFIHAEKGNAERGSLQLYDASGALNYSGDLKTIRGRGNSTWVVHEKKPYSLKLMDPADLLGMGAAKDWILLADALDSSAMRNKIVYDFAAKAGLSYTPEAQWTELYLNGEYAGLYLLCERVEVNSQRVDLTPDGSLVCMDRDIRVEEDPEPYFVTNSGQYLQVRESSDYGTLKALFQSMENAVLAQDGKDARTGLTWQELIDLESWVKKYLIEEIFDSYDANFQSQYFYCYETNPDSRIYAGPIWDYDASLGNPAVWALNSPRGLFAWRPQAMAGYETPWFNSLYQKDIFQEKLKEEYTTVFLPLLETLLRDTVSAYAQQLSHAFERNRLRWDVDTPGIEEEAQAIITYMAQRIDFLTQLWLEGKEFCIVRLQENQDGGYYAYYAVEPGTCFEDLPPKDEEDFLGWYREDTDTLFDPQQPITEDICLYPKFEGWTEEETGDEESLVDVLLQVYHYVPVVVLMFIGVIAAAVNHRKNRKRTQRQTEESKIG